LVYCNPFVLREKRGDIEHALETPKIERRSNH